MAKITGRTDDMMIVRGVNVFPSQIEEHLLTIEGLTPHYLCVLTRPGRMDELTVQVEAASETSTADERASMAAALRKKVKDRVGVTVRVEVLEPARPGALPRQGQADLRPASDRAPDPNFLTIQHLVPLAGTLLSLYLWHTSPCPSMACS